MGKKVREGQKDDEDEGEERRQRWDVNIDQPDPTKDATKPYSIQHHDDDDDDDG